MVDVNQTGYRFLKKWTEEEQKETQLLQSGE